MPDTSPPSTANVATACAIVGLVTGYLLGQAKSLGLFGGSPISAPPQRKSKAEASEDSEQESDEDDGVPSEFPGHSEECKMVLVVRTDLGMTKGTPSFLDGLLALALILNVQAKSARSAVTQYSHATRRSCDGHPSRRY